MRTSEASKNGSRVKRIAGVLGVPSRSISAKAASASRNWTHAMANSPGSERTACQDGMVVKARNHSRVASALPHSEGIAYKPPCGEVAMCPRVGRMGPVSEDGPGQHNPDPSEGPWGGGRPTLHGGASSGRRPRAVRGNRSDPEVHEGRRQTGRQQAYAGSRLKPLTFREGPA